MIITRGTDLWWRKAKLALHLQRAEKYFVYFIYMFLIHACFQLEPTFPTIPSVFYYFLDLLNPNLDLLFLKNAISLPFNQSLAEEIKYFFFSSLASVARCLYKETLFRAASPQSFKFYWLQSQYLKLKMSYFGFSFPF